MYHCGEFPDYLKKENEIDIFPYFIAGSPNLLPPHRVPDILIPDFHASAS
ncbi:MAG: hypothetical protein IPQ10_00145 [Saprospiraceae bacterium]|jgi:hypothetical protein|nr:hypothetical protein [Saprospiraceae bacterium]MBK7797125.1 hypothetical protein [Saprospiraceae bacterium]MBK8152072.1 hypothetical protein [Saprospiraceae bacterium]MBK9377395.1 hypothetical protein [Saprospiraceae bacterium]MBL0259484.1 hypothetical protein [Saprospiraceae bacterium]